MSSFIISLPKNFSHAFDVMDNRDSGSPVCIVRTISVTKSMQYNRNVHANKSAIWNDGFHMYYYDFSTIELSPSEKTPVFCFPNNECQNIDGG